MRIPFARNMSREERARRGMWDLVWVVIFFLFAQSVEHFLVILWATNVSGQSIGEGSQSYTLKGVYSIAMLCSGAASFVGGLIGFLFGIPQSNAVVQQSRTVAGAAQRADTEPGGPAGPASVEERAVTAARETNIAVPAAGLGSSLHRNTNLENISDALTKGLLAIGASQLYRVDGWVRSIAPALGESFGPGNGGQVVALSVLTFGIIQGFLFGYLATRIYLTGVFERSDPRS
jgi:hypothetical protein